MQRILRASLVASAFLGGGVAAYGRQQTSEVGALSPVTRVVELLKGLTKQIEDESKQEEDLYETFVCWAKSMISQKTDSNAAANSRIESLETYVKDLLAGRIELTTERADLEKEIETLRGDIEVATELRKKEAGEYEDAKAEMEQAITALTSAIEVLTTATKDHKEGSLIAMRGSMRSSAGARAAETTSLNLAVSLGRKMLTSGDAMFLQRLLTGEVPKPDWKKLNRKATFKMSYKARSDKIEGVLQKMLDTFKANLDEATKKEDEAQDLFDKLKKAKGDELQSALDALTKMEKENGARGLSKEEAQEEIDALKKQVTDDTKYIKQVEDALETKKTEWKARKELRAGELGAISKAIAILHSDDARDLFKRSYASQGFLFLQENAGSAVTALGSRAALTLRRVAAFSKDHRVAGLAKRAAAATSGHFDEVIQAIDKMLTTLKDEEAEDLKIKETCESDRAADTRDAIKASRTMDEHTETITALVAKIEELTKEIEEKEAQIVEIKAQLKQAKEDREKENKEYVVAKKDDEDAAALIKQAATTLEDFYKENGLALVQKKQPFVSTAGEAPPPPPPTWEGGYGGKTDEQAGVSAILGLIREDILKDISKADKEEAEAVALYEKTKKALETEKSDLEKSIQVLSDTRADAESDVEDNKGSRSTKAGELDVLMKKIKAAEPGCAFFQINYAVRAANRQAEIDGLTKAKAILQGGEFATPKDPNRELKPGDALLQQRPRLAPIRRFAA